MQHLNPQNTYMPEQPQNPGQKINVPNNFDSLRLIFAILDRLLPHVSQRGIL